MNCRDVCGQAGRIYLDLTFPERIVARSLEKQAKQHPKLAISLEVLASVVFGTIKVLTFPLASLSGIFLLPLRGIIQVFKTRQVSSILPYLVGGLISLLISAMLVVAVFSTILVAPEIVFVMIGVVGTVFMSATLLQLHEELFSIRDEIAYLPFQDSKTIPFQETIE